ncbi:MAG TPA: glycoside hydrolase, partial [Anaerolineae bacterium]
QWHANHQDDWHSLTARKGWLRLPAQFVEAGDLHEAANLLLQKLPAESFAVETLLEPTLAPGELAGLIVTGDQHAALALRRSDRGTQLVYVINGLERVIEPWNAASIRLRMELRRGGECTFSYSSDGKTFQAIQPAFQAVEGRWIGAKVGIFAVATNRSSDAGHADFDHFRFSTQR